VDDSAFARDLGRRILMSTGLDNITEASSCHEAIIQLRQTNDPIDIVFCDLMMPEMDGLQFIRLAASLPITPFFVFVSGAEEALLNTVESSAKARNLRVLRHVQKPFSLDKANQILKQATDLGPSKNTIAQKQIDVTAEDLTSALTQKQFFLHYQPKVSLADGTLCGFESLARWQHSSKTMIPPNVFIHAAEQNGLIGALTDTTVSLAIRQCATWAESGLNTKISVNLSAHMLVDIDLPDRLVDQVAQFGIEPQQLILEVTESGLFHNTADTLEILARLHMKGFPLSIDDFGTGYSSSFCSGTGECSYRGVGPQQSALSDN